MSAEAVLDTVAEDLEAPAATGDEAETAAELGDNPGAAPGDD